MRNDQAENLREFCREASIGTAVERKDCKEQGRRILKVIYYYKAFKPNKSVLIMMNIITMVTAARMTSTLSLIPAAATTTTTTTATTKIGTKINRYFAASIKGE
ncbi:MAG TPA: hypothetical protein VE593_01720 [Nitrososphaeraceae archaeon]|nr:hypothetical protein [Nitrososphaeraceae archaeon]